MSMQIKSFDFGGYTVLAPTGSRLAELCASLKKEFPLLKMGHKRKIWRHWIFHVLIVIFTFGMSRKYISLFTTTSKNRVDWSDQHHDRIQSGEGLDRVWECLMHEREHLRQFYTYGTFLMTLAWLAPFPILISYGRAMIEKRGIWLAFRRSGTLIVLSFWGKSSPQMVRPTRAGG